VLVVNAGSSSLKLRVLGEDDTVLAERWSGGDETGPLEDFHTGAPSVDAIGHRVVHGGLTLDELEDGLEHHSGLAGLS
jgi:acetate kinase